MKKLSFLILAVVTALLLSFTAFAAMTPGLNLLTGTTEAQTFDDLTALPSIIQNAVLDSSPVAGEEGKVLRHYTGQSITSQYGAVGFVFNPALDRNRPYQISFKAYKWAGDDGVGKTNTQLWIMKNGAAGWQIAKTIGSFSASDSWYNHSYNVSTFGSLTNKDTGLTDETDISKILIEWQYDSLSSYNTTEKIYIDDVSIIPAYKFTYLDEDGAQIRTSYENTTETTFAPVLVKSDMDKGIIGWSVKNDGIADKTITLRNEDVTLYAVYDNSLRFNLSADKNLLVKSGETVNVTSSLWHRNGVDGISVSYSVKEGSSYVTLKDNGNGTATVTAKAEGMAVITCKASTGESEDFYILVDYQTVDVEEAVQSVPTINASDWLYDHKGTTYNEAEGAWAVTKRTDVVKSDDGNGNIVYYNNGFLSKSGSLNTSTYRYLLFRLKADRTTNLQVALNIGGSYKYTYPSVSATNGEYVDVCADLYTLASGATASQFVLGITNHHDRVYIKDITLSSIPAYEPEIPEVKAVKLIKSVSTLSGDGASADVQAAAFSNKSFDTEVAWKSSSDCVAVKNNGNGYATLKAMSDGTATITAYAVGDETVSQSFNVTVSGQREKQAVYDIRILFWGASTTKHAPAASLGWYGDWGMAASAEENDYVHKLVSYLEKEFYPSKVTFEVVASSSFDNSLSGETSTTKDWTKHEQYVELESVIKDLNPNVIVTAMTGNMSADTPVDVAYNAYKQVYDMMYSYCPDAIVVAQHCGLSCKTRNDTLIEQLDRNYSDKVFYDYHVNPTMKLDPANLAPEFEHSGVASHWGDKGHDLVATTCLGYIKPEIPANIEAEYIYIPSSITINGEGTIDEKGSSILLTVTAVPNDASTDVVWSVDNSSIAVVSKGGVLTAVNNGTVTVTATSSFNNTVKASHKVVITNQNENFTLTYAPGTTDTVTGLPEADEYASVNYTLSDAIPSRDAYTFVGWGLTENASETVKVIDVKKDTTVYAIWKKTDGFEFEGTYDENEGFVYGFSIDGGFHNNVKDSFLYTTCTAGTKVTFTTPVIDIENANFVAFALTSGYMDNTASVKLTVTTTQTSKEYTLPLASTQYTTYVADISDLPGNVTRVSIFVDAVPADSSMFDIGIDYIRFTPVRRFDKTESRFAITDGRIILADSLCEGYVLLSANKEDTASLMGQETNTLVVTLDSGYSPEIAGQNGIYAKSVKAGANIGVKLLTGENKYTQVSSAVYTTTEEGTFEVSESLSDALVTYDEASIRIAEPKGLRVKASVPASFHLENEVAEYGFVITRKDTLDGGKINDLVLSDEYLAAKHVVYGAAFIKGTTTHKVYQTEADTEFFTAVLYNIPEEKTAMTTQLVFRPYVILTDGSKLYGAKVQRSVLDVAVALYFSSDSSAEVKARAKEILDICEYDIDHDIWVDADGLYKG